MSDDRWLFVDEVLMPEVREHRGMGSLRLSTVRKREWKAFTRLSPNLLAEGSLWLSE